MALLVLSGWRGFDSPRQAILHSPAPASKGCQLNRVSDCAAAFHLVVPAVALTAILTATEHGTEGTGQVFDGRATPPNGLCTWQFQRENCKNRCNPPKRPADTSYMHP